MKTVWVVEQGDYSDYHVVGVFSSKENAEVVANKINRTALYGKAEIAEWPVDPTVEKLHMGLRVIRVRMSRDGSSEILEELSYERSSVDEDAFQLRPHSTYGTPPVEYPAALYSAVWAKDEQHAIKITNERRIQLIAANQWPEEFIETS